MLVTMFDVQNCPGTSWL